MQFWTHLVLVIIGMAFFLYSFIKQRKTYQLLFVIWLPLTLLSYLSTNKVYLTVQGAVELIFFFLVIFFLFRNPNRKKVGYRAMLEELDRYGTEASEELIDVPIEMVLDEADACLSEDAPDQPEQENPLE